MLLTLTFVVEFLLHHDDRSGPCGFLRLSSKIRVQPSPVDRISARGLARAVDLSL